jgi:hypothetical protein
VPPRIGPELANSADAGCPSAVAVALEALFFVVYRCFGFGQGVWQGGGKQIFGGGNLLLGMMIIRRRPNTLQAGFGQTNGNS